MQKLNNFISAPMKDIRHLVLTGMVWGIALCIFIAFNSWRKAAIVFLATLGGLLVLCVIYRFIKLSDRKKGKKNLRSFMTICLWLIPSISPAYVAMIYFNLLVAGIVFILCLFANGLILNRIEFEETERKEVHR